MDKKDFENLSESELRELKEFIDEVLEEKKYKESYSSESSSSFRLSKFLFSI